MWSMFFIPWLSLFFMKQTEARRWLPVALFAVVLTTIIHDVGTTLGFWATRQATFPFYEMMPYYYGTIPVLTIWIFKFTYGRFGIYMVANTILDLGFNFFLLNYFLPSSGLYDFNLSPLQSLLITLIHAVVIYGYQLWQEGLLLAPKKIMNNNLQQVAAKPLAKQQDVENNDRE